MCPVFEEIFGQLFLGFTGAAGKYFHVQNDPVVQGTGRNGRN
jgi:hypothetical protein